MFLIMMVVSQAQAWEVLWTDEGDPLQYSTMPVTWDYDDSEAPDFVKQASHEAIVNSFETWNTIPGTEIHFQQEEMGDEDNNHVYWQEDWDENPNLLALTSTWSAADGEIVGFRIRINGQYDRWGTEGSIDQMDLQNAMTHEVGHALALDHNPELEPATMYPSATVGEVIKRNLTDDDMDAALFLYGNGYTPRVDGQGMGCSISGSSSAGFLGLLPLLLAFTRRNRRSSC